MFDAILTLLGDIGQAAGLAFLTWQLLLLGEILIARHVQRRADQ